MLLGTVITVRKRSLGQGNIFRSVCQEFCPLGGGGVSGLLLGVSAPGGSLLPGGLLRGGGVCSRGCLFSVGCAWWRPPGMATAAAGTHPTGMHSCETIVLAQTLQSRPKDENTSPIFDHLIAPVVCAQRVEKVRGVRRIQIPQRKEKNYMKLRKWLSIMGGALKIVHLPVTRLLTKNQKKEQLHFWNIVIGLHSECKSRIHRSFWVPLSSWCLWDNRSNQHKQIAPDYSSTSTLRPL